MFKTKFLKWLVVTLALVIISACGGGNSSSNNSNSGDDTNDNTQSYQLEEGNYAVMGPLKDAKVQIYRATNLDSPIETTTTNSSGKFELKLNNIKDNEVLLVVVSGGEDIDIDDDGVIDSTPTINNGSIHGFATAKDLRDGKVHITLLSEVVYFYTNYLFNRTSNEDMQKIISAVTSKLFQNQTLSQDEYLKRLYSFNPSKKEDKELLSFDYTKLIEDDSLSSLIYKNSPEVGTKIETLFAKILTPNDVRLLDLRDSVLVHLTPPMYANVTSKGSNIFFDYDNNKSLLSEYINKDSNITFSVTPNQGYKIIKWYGCDSLSADLTQCSINNIIEDKIVTPVVVPSEIVVNPSIDIQDITGAVITIDNDIYSVATTSSDFVMQEKLAQIDVDTVIVSKTEPVFFKKVTEVTKIDDTHYLFKTEFIPIEEIITQGYISSSLGTATLPGTQTPISTTAKIITSDGREFDMQQVEDGSYVIDLDQLYKTTLSIDDLDIGSTTFIKDDNIELIGKISVKPYIDLDMSWGFISGLTMFYIKPGVELKPEFSLKVFKEWKSYDSKPNETTIEELKVKISQIFMVGPVPISVNENIDVSIGVEGAIKGEIDLIGEFGADTGIPFKWTKSQGVEDIYINFKPFASFKTQALVEGYAGAYINFLPNIDVYGFGIGLANKFGVYGKISTSTGLDYKIEYDSSTNELNNSLKVVESTLEVYLQYQPELQLVTKYSPLQNIVDKFNRKYNEDHPLPKATFSLYKTSLDKDLLQDAKLPGFLEVEGAHYIDSLKVGDSLSKKIIYNISNSGEEDISWSVAMLSSSNILKSAKISKTSGELKAGEEDTIEVDLDISNITQPSSINGILTFFSNQNLMGELLGKLEPVREFNYNIKFYQEIPSVTGAELTVKDDENTIPLLNIQFNQVDSDIDGYRIYRADYNISNQECYNYGEFATLQGKESTQYEVTINSLLQSEDIFRKIEPNRSYCFNIVAFKDFNNIQSISNFMEESLIFTVDENFTKLPDDINITDNNLTDGLVAWYTFDDPNNLGKDSSGNGNDGIAYGGVSSADGVIGLAGSFDGVDDYIRVKHKDMLNLKNMTLSAWVYDYKHTNSSIILFKGMWNTIGEQKRQYEFSSSYDINVVNFGLFSSNENWEFIQSKESIPLRIWTHIVVLYDGFNQRIYINDKLENSKDTIFDNFIPLNPFDLTIGAGFKTENEIYNQKNGLIDDLRIYNRALSESEIKKLYEMREQ